MTYGEMNQHLIDGLRDGVFIAGRGQSGELIFATTTTASAKFRRGAINTADAVAEIRAQSVVQNNFSVN